MNNANSFKTNLELRLECMSKGTFINGTSFHFNCIPEIESERKNCEQIEALMNDRFLNMQSVAHDMINDVYESEDLLNDMFELEIKLDLLIIELSNLQAEINTKSNDFLALIISTKNALRLKLNRLDNKPISKKSQKSNGNVSVLNNPELALLVNLLYRKNVFTGTKDAFLNSVESLAGWKKSTFNNYLHAPILTKEKKGETTKPTTTNETCENVLNILDEIKKDIENYKSINYPENKG